MENHVTLYQIQYELTQSDDPACIRFDVNLHEYRTRRQTRHGGHGAQQRVEEPGANRGTYVADRDGEPGGDSL